MNKIEKLILEQISSNLPKVNPKLSQYYSFAEWVPVEYLDTVKEWDRNDKFQSWEYKSLDELYQNIVKNGLSNPVILKYSIPDDMVILSEGNHRLAVAKYAGWTHLPTIVSRTHYEFSDENKNKAKKVRPYDRIKYGDHIPSEFRPSKLGIPIKHL